MVNRLSGWLIHHWIEYVESPHRYLMRGGKAVTFYQDSGVTYKVVKVKR